MANIIEEIIKKTEAYKSGFWWFSGVFFFAAIFTFFNYGLINLFYIFSSILTFFVGLAFKSYCGALKRWSKK